MTYGVSLGGSPSSSTTVRPMAPLLHALVEANFNRLYVEALVVHGLGSTNTLSL
jgi:hypothetical protein